MSKKQKNARDEKLYKELKEDLFKRWKRRWNKSYHVKFAEDGILPWAGYSKHWPKILFIGREPYKCTGGPKCTGSPLMKDYYEGNFTCPAYHLLDKVAYGLINKKEWKDLPERNDIPRPPDGFSFAFVNVSKYANPEGPKLSENFENYARENLDFTRKEIDLLNPDLIISWNLAKELGGDFLEKLGASLEKYEYVAKVDRWTYTFDKRRDSAGRKKQIPLLDTYAFHAPGVEHKKYIYNPIMKAVKKLIAEGKLKPKQG